MLSKKLECWYNVTHSSEWRECTACANLRMMVLAAESGRPIFNPFDLEMGIIEANSLRLDVPDVSRQR
jgi:hypothetical protein